MHVLSDVPAVSVARKPAVFGVRGSECNLSFVLEQVQGHCAEYLNSCSGVQWLTSFQTRVKIHRHRTSPEAVPHLMRMHSDGLDSISATGMINYVSECFRYFQDWHRSIKFTYDGADDGRCAIY